VRKKLGEILLDEGLLTRAQLELGLSQGAGGRLGDTFIALGFVTPEQIARALAKQFELRFVSFREVTFDPEAVRLLHARTARRYKVVPVSREAKNFTIAMSDPLNVLAIDDIRLITGMVVEVLVMSSTDIDRALARLYPENQATAEEGGETAPAADAAPVVRLVSNLIAQAVRERASDIHLEPQEEGTRVRFRIDGLLHDITRIDKELSLPAISRLKIMAGLDISERRLPQDGSLRFTDLKEPLDVRMSSLPTISGEKLVLRLLRSGSTKLSLAQVGLADAPRQQLETMLKTNRQRQDYHAVLGTRPTSYCRPQYYDGRRPSRISRVGHQSSGRQRAHRAHFCQCTALLGSPRPRHHHGRRNSRQRNRRYSHSLRSHGAFGAVIPPYQ